MSTLVLIHGGWAGGWYWEKVVPELERSGHNVLTPDLPGHGDDRTPWPHISLESYVERTVDVLDAAPGPVTLVGHSSGGVVVAQACERRPDKVHAAVYLAAFLPVDGQSVFDLGRHDREGLIFPNLVVANGGGTATVRGEVIRDALFADCELHDYRRAVARFRPEPLAPTTTPVSLTGERFGRVPRFYVECRTDRALSTAPDVHGDPLRGRLDAHRPLAAVRGARSPGLAPGGRRRAVGRHGRSGGRDAHRLPTNPLIREGNP